MVARGNGALSICLGCAEAGRSSTVREQRAVIREAYGHVFVESAPDPAPARLLYELMREDRDRWGFDFDGAWHENVEFVLERIEGKGQEHERAQWRIALEGLRDAWQAAWDCRPGPGSGLRGALLDALGELPGDSNGPLA
jgi:hypothetical protein